MNRIRNLSNSNTLCLVGAMTMVAAQLLVPTYQAEYVLPSIFENTLNNSHSIISYPEYGNNSSSFVNEFDVLNLFSTKIEQSIVNLDHDIAEQTYAMLWDLI